MSTTKTQFHNLVQDYNLFCKRKYRRAFWRDLAPEAFAQHPSLRDALLSWADREGKLRTAEAPAINRFLNETHSFETAARKRLAVLAKDPEAIANILLDGHLVVIPNGKIYVIFGVDDADGTNGTARKINLDKLRHPLMPVGRLGFADALPDAYVADEKARVFLHSLVQQFRPIALLLPDAGQSTAVYAFYEDDFFDQLGKAITAKAGQAMDIYISSANITTTGANTTAEGVVKDFAWSDFVVGVVDAGDLKQQSKHNNSSTIVQCSAEGVLSYYRIGCPSREAIARFAKQFDIDIRLLPTTRATTSR